MSAEVKRYHPVLISLHWLLAVAILLAIVLGGFVLDDMASDNIHKPGLLRMHVTLGALILLFTLVRLAVRAGTAKPEPVDADNPLACRVSVGTQHLMYTLTVLGALSGLMLAFKADLFAFLYNNVGTLPKSFDDYAAHGAHGVLVYALLGVVALHLAAALKHQFVLKDNIFSRISLIQRD